jgi:Bacterial Ig-like domain
LYAVSDEGPVNGPHNHIYTLDTTTAAATLISTTSITPAGLAPIGGSPPTSVITQKLANDAGVSNTDLITSDGQVTVSGQGSEQLHSVQIWNAVTHTQIGTANIAADNESWTFTTNLAQGSYQLYAKLTDVYGNMGQTPLEPTIVVDQTPPVPAMLNVIYNSGTNLTTLTGTSEANSSVSIFDGAKLIGTVTAASNGSWSKQTALAGNGIHTFTETSTDLAGNAGKSAGVTLFAQNPKQLQGGSGNDVLIGGPNDKLTGNGGTDTFVFNPNFGKVTVTDFNVNQDALAFDHTLFANATPLQVINQAHDAKAGAVIGVDANDTITLTGVSVAQLQNHLGDIHFF